MADITTELQTIAEAVYGSDMRQAIHDAIYKTNNESTDNRDSIIDLTNNVAAVERSVDALEDTVDGLARNIDMTKSYQDEEDNTIFIHLERVGDIGIATATVWLKHPELLMGTSTGTVTIINDFSASYRPQEDVLLPLMLDSDGEALAASRGLLPSLELSFVSPTVTISMTEIKGMFQSSSYNFSNYLLKGRYTVQRVYRIYKEE